MKRIQFVTLPGDGIGPEVLDEAVKVLARAAEKVGLHNWSEPPARPQARSERKKRAAAA